MLVNTTDGVHDSKRFAAPPCVVMEICDKSIKELMRERHYPHFRAKTNAGQPEDAPETKFFKEEEVVRVGLDVLNALQDLHSSLQTYHGDISAKNVMRVRQGRYVPAHKPSP